MDYLGGDKQMPFIVQFVLGVIGMLLGVFTIYRLVFSDDKGSWVIFGAIVGFPFSYIGYMLIFSKPHQRVKGLLSSEFLYFFGWFWIIAMIFLGVSGQPAGAFAGVIGVASIALASNRKNKSDGELL